MLPSLSKLSLVSIGSENEERGAKRQKTDNRVELTATESTDRIVSERGDVLNVACVSVAEMTIAKVVLDALIQQHVFTGAVVGGKHVFEEMPFHNRLFRGYKEHLKKIFVAMEGFEDELKKRLEIATENAVDIQKCIEIIDLLRPSKAAKLRGNSDDAGVEESSSMYKTFLLNYAEERGLSMTQLLHMDDDDDEDDEEDRYGGVYTPGVNSVLSEYFSRPYYYATSRSYTHVLRSFATSPKSGRPVCVGVVMLTLRDHHDALVATRNYQDGERRPMRMQGIVGCSIYKHFYHAPVGNALLKYAQGVARREGNVIAVDPLKDNEAWEKKLRASENVIIGTVVPQKILG